MLIYRVFIFVLLITFSTYAKESIIRSVIDTHIQEIINSSDISDDDVGVYVKSLSSDKVIYEKNADKVFIPASNQKLITTTAALLILGPDFRFETKFFTDERFENIYIVGNFNPEIDQSYYERFAEFLKAKGIKKIDGNIFVYSVFSPSIQGWPEKDSNYCFTANPSDIPISENCLKIKVIVNKGIHIQTIPDAYLDVISYIKISKHSSSSITANISGNKLILSGTLKDRSSYELSIPIKEPPQFNLLTLANILRKNGISFNKLFITKSLPSNLRLIYTIKSSPLREIIKKANKDSNNFIAEQIYAYIGKENIMRTFRNIKVDTRNISLYDGSGLSRYNVVSPRVLGEILESIYKTPYFDDFFNSLAVAGKDGTLKHRLSDPDMAGKIYAKTGYIKGVKNLSGYIVSNNGEVYIFSILINNLKSTKYANELQEKICKILINTDNFSNLDIKNKTRL